MQIKESDENYLEMILILKEQNGQVRSIDVANELGFSKASVSVAMKKLRESGFIHVEEDGSIVLEPSGYDIASKMYDRHKTLTQLLIDAGVNSDTAAKDACKMEHVISNESYQCLKSYYLDHKASSSS